MADTAREGSPTGFLFLAIVVHFFDALLRYGTTPIAIGSSPGSPGLWVLFFFLYGMLFVFANNNPVYRSMGKSLLGVSLIAYIWGPFWSIIPGYFPALKYVAALVILIAPFWLIVTFYATQSFPKLSMWYSLIWMFIVVFALFPNVQQFATEQGHPLPDSLSPGMVYQYGIEKLKDSGRNVVLYFSNAGKTIGEDVQRQLAIASGDYYTGKVDNAAKQKLGVYLENFHATDQMLYPSAPIDAVVTMKAETLDTELNIAVACDADGNVSASKVLPKNAFTVLTYDQYDIDCIWNKGVLGVGAHTLNFRSEFDFTTRAYLKSYLMDQDRLREYRRQNVDPLASIPDKNPVAVYTSGPVRIGMSLGKQPIPLGKNGDALQSWGVTVENSWEGKVLGITGLTLAVPKGIAINDPASIGAVLTTCDAVPEEERVTCDDTLVNVYALTADELQSPGYKNLTVKSLRIPLTITDPTKVLGKAPIGVQNFKASVQYRYLLERSLPVQVREEPK